MTKALRKERKRHLNFISSLPIDKDVKNEAIQYILFLEKSKKEAKKVWYCASVFTEKSTVRWLYQCFDWAYSKQDVSFWVYIKDVVETKEIINEQKISLF